MYEEERYGRRRRVPGCAKNKYVEGEKREDLAIGLQGLNQR